MNGVKVNQILDTRGMFSPYPETEARDALKAIAKGQVLEVLGNDPVAKTTFPSLCNRLGYFYEIIDEEKGQWRFLDGFSLKRPPRRSNPH